MSDEELLTLLQEMKDRCDKQAQDLARLAAAGVTIRTGDGGSIDDLVEREYQAGQSIEQAMEPIRDRIASRTSAP